MKRFKFFVTSSVTSLALVVPAIAHANPFHDDGGVFGGGGFWGFGGSAFHGHGGAICGAPAPSLAAGVSSLLIIGGALMTSKFVKRSRGNGAG
jgi:hypothetical protein